MHGHENRASSVVHRRHKHMSSTSHRPALALVPKYFNFPNSQHTAHGRGGDVGGCVGLGEVGDVKPENKPA